MRKQSWAAYMFQLRRQSSEQLIGCRLVNLREKLDAVIDKVCAPIVRVWHRRHPSYQEFILSDKLKQSRRDVRFLQEELAQARERIYSLEQLVQKSNALFAEVFSQTDEELSAMQRFAVRQADSGGSWEVVTEHCCLGGCDLGVYPFASEREALLYATLLRAVGFKPAHNVACPSCYAAHMRDCI